MYINAVGKACPMPVMMTKKELDKGCMDLTVAVDNKIAVENLSRLAENHGFTAAVTEKEGIFEVHLQKGEVQPDAASQAAVSAQTDITSQSGTTSVQPELTKQTMTDTISVKEVSPSVGSCNTAGCGYAVFIGKDIIGDGERELGENLLKMAIYTLSQSDEVPASILFMNSGVKLPAGEEQQVIDSLQELTEKGTEVLVCGTCLNYYGLTDDLKIGKISNMYDILGKMHSAAKVISL